MSLSDISSGMSFANNYNDMINEANVQALSDATQLTAIKQEGADNTALKKVQLNTGPCWVVTMYDV